MNNKIEKFSENAVIKVIGIGGGGSNAVEYMAGENIKGIEFFSINTDIQALKKISTSKTIQIGKNITKGLGTGSNPEIGRKSAEEDKEILNSILNNSDMIFIAAGMGGGTGTGASPIIAEIAKDLGILTVAVVTKPFSFEGKKRMICAENGLIELSKIVDSIIVIPNNKLLKNNKQNISLIDAFNLANNILKNAVQGTSELITKPGLINVDFADIRAVMSEMGYSIIGFGFSNSENRAEEAIEMAISSPFLENIDLSGAKGVLINISSGLDLRLDEFEIIGNYIKKFASEDAVVIIGTSLDKEINNEIRITIIATGVKINKCSESIESFSNKNNDSMSLNIFNKKNLEIIKNKNEEINKNIKYDINDNLDYLNIPTFLRKKNINN